MERGFLSQKESGMRRGVKEKDINRNKKNTFSGTDLSADLEVTLNDDTPVGVASAVQDGVTPSAVNMTVKMGKHKSLDDTTILESFPPLSTPVNTVGNAPDENLLKEDVSTVPVWVKLYGVPVTAFNEDGLNTIATKLGAGERKNVKKPSQISQGVLVNNDVKFGTNGETTNLVNNEAISNGSSFMNIDNDGEFASNTPVGEKIDKIKRQICEDKLRLLDNDGNPLVPLGIMESDSEVDVVFDETDNLGISTNGKDESDKGYGTNSLLEQWMDSYLNNDDYDPYDDDMYKNHDLSEQMSLFVMI
uniref:DUF4283 domain-containing protein n=1 Tax=Tanacetum cinerariifolium TaxID=118510 RepID=A0A6L2LXY8_TANCI|nr:hypothetical protein [Tanacetum cinerariifolium]